MQILYCFKCKVRLADQDFEKGLAFHLENGATCAQCSPDLKPVELKIIKESGVPAAPRAARKQQPPPRPPASNRLPLILAGIGLAAAAAIGAVFLTGGDPPPPAPKAQPPKTALAPPPPVKPPDPHPVIKEEPRTAELPPPPAKPPEPPPEPKGEPKAEPPPPVSAPPAEAAAASKPTPVEAYRTKWNEAASLAAVRSYAPAVRLLEERLPEIEDKELQGEALRDIELMRRVREIHDKALAALAGTAKGRPVKFEARDANGDLKKFDGSVAGSEPGWLLVRQGKEETWVDLVEVTPVSLVELFKAGGGKDPAASATLLLLEGEIEAAKSAMEGSAEKPPAKVTALPGAQAEESAEDKAARALYHATVALERGYPAGCRRGGLAAIYRRLLEDPKATRFAKLHARALEELLLPAPEYLFFMDGLKTAGTFKAGTREPVGACVISDSDSADAATLANFVELAFEAQPGAAYKIGIYAGACCRERFVAFLQGTGLTDKNRQTGAEMALTPGSTLARGVTALPSRLPRTHAAHAGREVIHWGWIELELPKTEQGGARAVRLMTNRSGMSVACAVASAQRRPLPLEKEMKELSRQAVEAAATEAPTPNLIAHWKFDEGKGTSARDSMPGKREALFVKNPQWAPGLAGTAVGFKGDGDHLEVKGGESLLNGLEAFTVAVWIRAAALGSDQGFITGREPHGGDSGFSIRHDAQGNNGKASKCFKIGVTTAGGTLVLESSANVHTLEWQHVALTWRGGEPLTIYLNGKRDTPSHTSGNGSGALTGNTTFRIGQGAKDTNGSWRGLVDDLRLYNRALSAADIEGVMRAGRKR